MSEELKTIKELADELDVSKQNIRYHMKFLPVKNTKKNEKGQLVLNAEEQRFIKDRTKSFTSKKDENIAGKKKSFTGKEKQENITDKVTVSSEKEILYEKLLKEKDKQINDLKNNRDKQLTVKDEQIKSLVEAQKQTQNLLDQQQRLALQDKKLLEEYRAENDSLKALKIPSEDTTEEQTDKQSQEVNNGSEQPIEAPRKWYQFWK